MPMGKVGARVIENGALFVSVFLSTGTTLASARTASLQPLGVSVRGFVSQPALVVPFSGNVRALTLNANLDMRTHYFACDVLVSLIAGPAAHVSQDLDL
eukprot:8536619-Pyramimonas_sp.AAC.1